MLVCSLTALFSLTGCYGNEDPMGTAVGASLAPSPITLDPCIFQAARPNLVLSAFEVVSDGGMARINATVRNRGCATSGVMPYALRVTLDGASYQIGAWAPSSIQGTPTGTIARGATQSFTFNTGWPLTQVQRWGGQWHIVVDYKNYVDELSESNNMTDQHN